MIFCRRVIITLLCCAGAVRAQYTASERVVLPADKTEADLLLAVDPKTPDKSAVDSIQMTDPNGTPLSPQPQFGAPAVSGGVLTLHLSMIYFFSEARLQVRVNGARYVYQVQRGPLLAVSKVSLKKGGQTELWLYNFETHPVKARWRVVSGAGPMCGQGDCWNNVTLGPARSDPISFIPPDDWFGRPRFFSPETWAARLELSFGADPDAPLDRIPLELQLEPHFFAASTAVIPPYVTKFFGQIGGLLRVIFWVTLGAVCLMLAQVMIPNFRKILQMEGQIEGLRERLNAIGSRVGNRLYTRCYQEIDGVGVDLAMIQPPVAEPEATGEYESDHWFLIPIFWIARQLLELSRWAGKRSHKAFSFFGVKRMLLAGNSTDVNRIGTILQRIEARMRLTERLDEVQAAILDSDTSNMPPSLCWSNAKQLRNVQTILSRQYVTAVDEKSASDSMDLLANDAASIKDFAARLETQIATLKKLFAVEPWKSDVSGFSQCLHGCEDLLADTPPRPSAAEWSTEEIIQFDLAAVKLAIIYQMIALECKLKEDHDVEDRVMALLTSTDPAQLHHARQELTKLSQGISDEKIRKALEDGMWDVYYEPETITERDVLRCSLIFRDKDMNRSAAKELFQCEWCLSMTALDKGTPAESTATPVTPTTKTAPPSAGTQTEADDDDGIYETGWDVQFIRAHDKVTVTPEVYDSTGHPVSIRGTDGKTPNKGKITFNVEKSKRKPRVVRGLIDATITALVPVITVAVTQFNNGGQPNSDLDFKALVLLGFTSQAIRAAVVPDTSDATPDTAPAKPAAAAS
jgi:hypothetical protein